MNLLILLTSVSMAGMLRVEATLPAEVAVDDVKVATLLVPSTLEFGLSNGQHKVSIWVQGVRTNYEVVFSEDSVATIIAGRTGISVNGKRLAPTVVGTSKRSITLRSTAKVAVSVIIDGEWTTLPPAGQSEIELGNGVHTMQVRSGDGTVIWANDTLHVEPGEPAILQVADGVAPELFGEAIVFGSGPSF